MGGYCVNDELESVWSQCVEFNTQNLVSFEWSAVRQLGHLHPCDPERKQETGIQSNPFKSIFRIATTCYDLYTVTLLWTSELLTITVLLISACHLWPKRSWWMALLNEQNKRKCYCKKEKKKPSHSTHIYIQLPVLHWEDEFDKLKPLLYVASQHPV